MALRVRAPFLAPRIMKGLEMFKNPCKKCLVRACCSITCQKKEDFEKHIGYFKTPIMVISIVIAVIIIAFLLILFSQITHSEITQIITSLFIWFIPFIFFILCYFNEMKNDLSREHPLIIIGHTIIGFIMSPIIIISFPLIILCEKVIGSEII